MVYTLKPLKNRGDTIIEVLLAITIITATMAGAFASADLSKKNSRRAQERTEALKLTEAHLERFKVAASSKGLITKAVTPYYCIDDNLDIIHLNSTNLDDFNGISTYPTECKIIPQGGVNYYISIQRNGFTFTVSTRWDRLGGNNNNVPEDIHLTYRQYE